MEGDFRMRRVAVVVFALLAAVAIGAIAYQAGVAHGVGLQPGAVEAYRYYRPWPFGFFFGPLFGILFFFFILRFLFWGLCGWGWGWRRWRYYDYPGDGPSRFDEWHRRAHEQMRDDHAPSAPTA